MKNRRLGLWISSALLVISFLFMAHGALGQPAADEAPAAAPTPAAPEVAPTPTTPAPSAAPAPAEAAPAAPETADAKPDAPAAAAPPKAPAAEAPAKKAKGIDTAAATSATGKVSLTKLKEQGADMGSSWSDRMRSLVGLVFLLGICFVFSSNRKAVSWRLVVWGVGLQIMLGFLVLKTDAGKWLFGHVNTLFVKLMAFTEEGAAFLFGNLARSGNVPVGPGGAFGPVGSTESVASVGAFFAFNVLPTIIFFSSLMAVLYHIGFMQWIVRGVAWVMRKTMGTSGSETLSASGNIFVGQTEAPLLVRPFVNGMTQSELMAVMTGGFATVAGGVMAAYISFLKGYFDDVAGHLLSASVMSAPAALVCAKLMIPEPDPTKSETYGECKVEFEKADVNMIDAAARGAGDGLKLAFNVGAMLLAFIALIAMFNAIVGWGAGLMGFEGITIQTLLGYVLAPVAWIMGVPWVDSFEVGQLLGVKTVINEFVAYMELGGQLSTGALESPRSVIIATYALCGFANFGSIAIQIGGIGGIAPKRRGDLAKIGLRAMIAGTIACLLTATVAGLLI